MKYQADQNVQPKGAFGAECATRITDPNALMGAGSAETTIAWGAAPGKATKEVEALKARTNYAHLWSTFYLRGPRLMRAESAKTTKA